jgi:hypothetical protein
MCILNILKGEFKVYNIENISDNDLSEYLHLLINNYDPGKKITTRIITTKKETEITTFSKNFHTLKNSSN